MQSWPPIEKYNFHFLASSVVRVLKLKDLRGFVRFTLFIKSNSFKHKFIYSFTMEVFFIERIIINFSLTLKL